MADTGKEILDSGHVPVNGQQTEALAALRQYFDILLLHWVRLAACGVSFAGLDPNRGGGYYTQAYHAEDDIDLKAFRDTSQTLRTAGAGTQTQLDLIAQTENLHHHWNDPASDAALHNYLTNKDRMEQDQSDLVAHQQNIAQVAENLQKALEAKRDMAVNAVDKLVNQALRNSPGISRTGCAPPASRWSPTTRAAASAASASTSTSTSTTGPPARTGTPTTCGATSRTAW
ncbi:hypothetical protein Srot_0288 [Segniliparus rotundus DSM 44985]|uniref:Uncharacterized protein n=1 Tax=Segniliparus rotundus (strain ATCC BAA-972 / CDC 1076 / CIP 108378 / DSM 44985 / JCM 13578) TaxID=640132 RepID=D6ZB16_SEGRD|nr:hypothetical protein Srot_0288 [Segniliparus rotundus DSM 44985]